MVVEKECVSTCVCARVIHVRVPYLKAKRPHNLTHHTHRDTCKYTHKCTHPKAQGQHNPTHPHAHTGVVTRTRMHKRANAHAHDIQDAKYDAHVQARMRARICANARTHTHTRTQRITFVLQEQITCSGLRESLRGFSCCALLTGPQSGRRTRGARRQRT